MAGEIFIARQDTLEDVQGTVNTIDTNVDAVNTTTTAIKSETESIKTDTEAIKLSTETIDQIADTILERIGLTNDSGGGTTAGSIFAKLNALLSAGSGGITGFKYISKSGTFTYTTQASGIVFGIIKGMYAAYTPSLSITKGAYLEIERNYEYEADYKYIGFFTNGATIKGVRDGNNDIITANIFEFI